MIIDHELRDKHARIHSAGHLVDLAVDRLSKFLIRKNTSGKQGKDIIFWMDLTCSIKGNLKMLSKQ